MLVHFRIKNSKNPRTVIFKIKRNPQKLQSHDGLQCYPPHTKFRSIAFEKEYNSLSFLSNKTRIKLNAGYVKIWNYFFKAYLTTLSVGHMTTLQGIIIDE
jgi:hypothetical protein